MARPGWLLALPMVRETGIASPGVTSSGRALTEKFTLFRLSANFPTREEQNCRRQPYDCANFFFQKPVLAVTLFLLQRVSYPGGQQETHSKVH